MVNSAKAIKWERALLGANNPYPIVKKVWLLNAQAAMNGPISGLYVINHVRERQRERETHTERENSYDAYW